MRFCRVLDGLWLVSREWCQCKPKAVLVHGRDLFPMGKFWVTNTQQHAQETNTFAWSWRGAWSCTCCPFTPHASSRLGWATCSVLELTIYCVILPGLGTFCPVIQSSTSPTLSSVNCASIFVSVLNCFCECYVLETQCLCPPKFTSWNLLPHVINFKVEPLGGDYAERVEPIWMGSVLL